MKANTLSDSYTVNIMSGGRMVKRKDRVDIKLENVMVGGLSFMKMEIFSLKIVIEMGSTMAHQLGGIKMEHCIIKESTKMGKS